VTPRFGVRLIRRPAPSGHASKPRRRMEPAGAEPIRHAPCSFARPPRDLPARRTDLSPLGMLTLPDGQPVEDDGSSAALRPCG